MGDTIINVNINVPTAAESVKTERLVTFRHGGGGGDGAAAPGNPNPKGRMLCFLTNGKLSLSQAAPRMWIIALAWNDLQRTSMGSVKFRITCTVQPGAGTVKVRVPHTTAHSDGTAHHLGDLY